jgi:hypothetical protein
MGRFSRVKGGCGKKSEAPDLEAHFSDGAWYDIVLRAADPTRNRFLVQVCSPPHARDVGRDEKEQPYHGTPRPPSIAPRLRLVPLFRI